MIRFSTIQEIINEIRKVKNRVSYVACRIDAKGRLYKYNHTDVIADKYPFIKAALDIKLMNRDLSINLTGTSIDHALSSARRDIILAEELGIPVESFLFALYGGMLGRVWNNEIESVIIDFLYSPFKAHEFPSVYYRNFASSSIQNAISSSNSMYVLPDFYYPFFFLYPLMEYEEAYLFMKTVKTYGEYIYSIFLDRIFGTRSLQIVADNFFKFIKAVEGQI